MIWFGIAVIGAFGILLEDLKWRMVHLWWYLILSVGLLGISFVSKGVPSTLLDLLWNFLFVASLLLLLSIYLSVKNRRFILPFDNYLGWGDVLFFVTLTGYFDLPTYIIFMILSLLAALALWSCYL